MERRQKAEAGSILTSEVHPFYWMTLDPWGVDSVLTLYLIVHKLIAALNWLIHKGGLKGPLIDTVKFIFYVNRHYLD